MFSFATLTYYLQERRLITGYNSDGFFPGEGAGAVLLSLGKSGQGGTHITGIKSAFEPVLAVFTSFEPLISAIGSAFFGLGGVRFAGNPYDGDTLKDVLSQVETVCGSAPAFTIYFSLAFLWTEIIRGGTRSLAMR